MVTRTVTPASEPVVPLIVNPAAFSAMFTVSSPAMVSRFSRTGVRTPLATAGRVVDASAGSLAVSVANLYVNSRSERRP